MIKLLASILVGPLFDAINKAGERRLSREALAAEIEKALIASQAQIAAEQSKVIVAEAQGESWLQRSWRPIVALTAFFSYWFVIFPYGFLVKWGFLPQVYFGEQGLDNFFWLTAISVGGYIGGRTIEKVMRK